MNEVLESIKNRRSVRAYKSEQIEEDVLNQILEAGIYAPTAHFDQPWYFTVVQNGELLDEMNAKSKAFMLASGAGWMEKMASDPDFTVSYNAPTVVVVSGRQNAMAWQVDCAAATQNMLIAAESLGVGSVWIGLMNPALRDEEVIKKLKIPEGYKPFYAISFGYREGKRPHAPKRNTDVINFIK